VILLTTIIGLGVVVGLTTMRDHIVQQFGDVAISIDALDQSFSTSNMGSFTDPGAVTDTANTEPGGLYVRLPASNE
jgi:hypothetical protein